MKKTMKATALFLAAGLLLTACGGKTDTAATTAAAESAKADAGTTAAAAEADAKKPSFVFVCTGQLGDKSFNDSANAGMEKIASDLGCEIKVIEIGRDQTKWEPTFQDLAEEGKYDVIISNGSSSAEVIEQVAEEFPDQKFVMFDSDMEEGKWPNLYAISYKQNEGSYLAGVLAALVTESKDMPNANEDKKIGFVGGSEHPIITDFLVGYIAGAKSVDPDIKVYVSYIGSWDDTAKGKVILNKTDKETGEPLKGVEFELRDSKGKVLETLKTDAAGHAESKLYEIATFKNGKYDTAIKYYLVETKTLDGYTLDQTKHEVTFAYADDSTPVVEVTFNLTNEKPEVPETPSTPDVPQSHEETKVSDAPKTGDNTNIWLPILLLLISTGGMAGLYISRKKIRKQ